jgi:excisionase family DNA binding protein
MKTFDILEAADFLKMHPQTLRKRAAAREIPSAKPGKHWVFIDTDLAEWLRSQYHATAKEQQR